MCIDLKVVLRVWSAPILGWIRLRRPLVADGSRGKGYYTGHFHQP